MRATVVLITTGSAAEASRLAELLVRERLAACVNIVGPVRSVFRWQGKVEKQQEYLLVCKTRHAKVSALARRVREVHSYDLPEVIALPISGGLDDYLGWIASETRPERLSGQLSRQQRKRRRESKQ